jgi:NAD-dependent dihydropyrimidine dehydrogenase PreA subunit
MTDSNIDIFEQVADMIIEEDIVAPPKTPAFLKILSLQFTKEEARIALKLRTTGCRLSEIAERTGLKPEKMEKKLLAMAEKGTVYYDTSSSDPVYRVVKTAAPGFSETGLWGGVRYPYTVELGKAMHEMVGSWASEKLAKLGFPYAPVWAAIEALPEGADAAHNIAEAIRKEGHWSVSSCPCRLSHWLAEPGNHCEHMLESCIMTGEESRWAVKHGMARALTYEQCVEVIKACNTNGLVSTLNIQNNICNCCNDCCALFRADASFDGSVFIPSPYLAEGDDDKCNACGICVERCPVHAITVDKEEKTVSVSNETCFGCGLCVIECKPASLRLALRV